MRTGLFAVGCGDERLAVEVTGEGEVRVEGERTTLVVVPIGTDRYRVSDGQRSWLAVVAGEGEDREVFIEGEVFLLDVVPGTSAPRRARHHADLLAAPMPAKVTAILVSAGEAVRKGDLLITLEAMKMQLPLHAPRDGVVASIACREGELVQPGVRLVELT